VTDTDAMTALSNALLSLTHRDTTPPCADGSDRWTSESRDERTDAARLCTGCPLFDPCGQYADEISAVFGVWSGVDRSPNHDRRRHD
jgi:hypothetical protein